MVMISPVVTEPVNTEPVNTEPVVTEPVISEPVVTNPVNTNPVNTNPVVSEPVVPEPVVTVPAIHESGKLYELPLASIQPDPEQPRKFFDEQALVELSASITSHGVLQPILVRRGAGGISIIVSGERRYQASINAGLATIPAIITDGEPAEISIIENLLRENLTAIEEAEAIERLRAVHD
jgi:ParB family chromosome partitioning protein